MKTNSEQILNKSYLLQRSISTDSKRIELIGKRNDEKKIVKIEPDAFKDFHKLEEIRIRNHTIDTIETGTFSYLANLKKIDLVNNKIKRLEPKVFTGSKKLEEIDLSQNKLTHHLMDSIDKETFYNLKRLKLVELSSERDSWIAEDTNISYKPLISNESDPYRPKMIKKDLAQIILRTILLVLFILVLFII